MNVWLQPPARRTRKALLVYSYWYVPYYTSLQQTAAALIIINIIDRDFYYLQLTQCQLSTWVREER